MIAAVWLAGCLTGAHTLAVPLGPSQAQRTAILGSSRAASTSFAWPLQPPEITRPFHPPVSPYSPGHRGVDLTGNIGQPVLAAGAGLVLYAGRMVDRDVISIEHPGGLRTTYEPVAATVAAGEQVARGQPIGHLEPGHPGCTAGFPQTCLHWGVRRRENYLDPLRLLGQGRVRLLPWDDSPPRGGH
jgi:murein DD-endopeptidase MepM/ murein hydrolase activator NlpD